MQLKKLMVSFLAIACLLTNCKIAAYAATATPYVDNDISLMYEMATNLSSSLTITDKTAYCVSTTGGVSDVESITVTQTLQKHWGLWIWNGVDGAEWTKTVNGHSIALANSIGNLDSGTYRVKSVFTLTDKLGKTETITIYSTESKIAK